MRDGGEEGLAKAADMPYLTVKAGPMVSGMTTTQYPMPMTVRQRLDSLGFSSGDHDDDVRAALAELGSLRQAYAICDRERYELVEEVESMSDSGPSFWRWLWDVVRGVK